MAFCLVGSCYEEKRSRLVMLSLLPLHHFFRFFFSFPPLLLLICSSPPPPDNPPAPFFSLRALISLFIETLSCYSPPPSSPRGFSCSPTNNPSASMSTTVRRLTSCHDMPPNFPALPPLQRANHWRHPHVPPFLLLSRRWLTPQAGGSPFFSSNLLPLSFLYTSSHLSSKH